MTPSEKLILYSGLLGASAVGLGAMGAHGLSKTLIARGMLDNWKTASLYQLFSAASLTGIAALVHLKSMDESSDPSSIIRAGNLIATGTLLFSGSIYLLCFPEIPIPRKILGPTTPIGGLIMIAGWSILGLSSLA